MSYMLSILIMGCIYCITIYYHEVNSRNKTIFLIIALTPIINTIFIIYYVISYYIKN